MYFFFPGVEHSVLCFLNVKSKLIIGEAKVEPRSVPRLFSLEVHLMYPAQNLKLYYQHALMLQCTLKLMENSLHIKEKGWVQELSPRVLSLTVCDVEIK